MTAPSNDLPVFSAIKPAEVEGRIRALLDANRAELERLLSNNAATWDSLIVPLEEMQHRLSRTWSPVGHMNGVVNSDELRAAYNACLPLLTAWNTDLAQNERLHQAYETVLKNEGARLSPGQRKLVENALRDFRLAGVALPPEKKQRYKELVEKLATLQSKFDENVLDATNAWSRLLTDEKEIEGLPAPIVERARAAAEAKQQVGWLFTLDAPNYTSVMMHAVHEPLRRDFYHGWTTRASEQDGNQGRWDNTELMDQILAVRHEVANLVGYPNYAEYSLATKMASSVPEVRGFLEQLATKSKPVAQQEFDELTKFAGGELNAWDVAFYAEKLKRERFNLSEEALRPYFPLPRVLAGMFSVAEKLYGVKIAERAGVDIYHPDVRFYDILNDDGSRRGSFFVDLYARAKKRGGAWMDECVGRKHMGGATSLPVAYLVCNFMPPVGSQPSLLTHSEVVTMFHEFGHGLHHMLTRVDYPSIAGINGVAWDAVELPSQFMENFAWRAEVIPMISAHVETDQPLPEAELQRLLGTRTFQAGMQTVRQLEFALFDLRIHSEFVPGAASKVLQTLGEVRSQVAVVKPPAFNRFPNSFQHIFSGGYAAGYYSYKWAEVLAADAFSAFEEGGIFNRTVSSKFLSAILEQGGSRDAMDAFVEFRGRKPTIEPLLKQLGLAA
ncbi:M3 family metallopeptidase [Steroidobacter agaridevorans]|uniref:M3 family metallopeptidase n=1 Tax=Steroidobacter agaridevorans TaxID=2695856 RepID=UPI001321F07C|nr:M3 family metallopeptidase [Steroidobacter agaridevorans]GFE89390.1 oligopeptidase A [Steroidobacter agaridevorans]